MKKFLLVAVLTAVAACANAQFYAGGTLGVGVTSQSYGDEDQTTTAIGLAPEFGYNINSNIAVGLEVAYAFSKVGDADEIHAVGVDPYVRFSFGNSDNRVRFFTEVYAGYAYLSQGGYDADGFEVGLRPGITVKVSNRVDLLAKMTLLSYSDVDDLKTTTFQLAPSSVSLGLAYNF